MAAITKIARKTGVSYRVTINRAGVRPFSRNFKTKKTAVAWAKKTEGDLEATRVEGANIARNLTLATLITELVNSRTINPATVIALTWWKDIRRAIYTTNAIESLNSVIRKAIKKRKLFPTDDAAKKVVYLAIQQASKKWTMPIRNWKAALNRFMIEFEDRLIDYA